VTSRGSITDTVAELLLRGLLSPAGHMAWTGITAPPSTRVPQFVGSHEG